MKIHGYFSDWFDSMIYSYGVDQTIRLDRTLFLNPDKDFLEKFKSVEVPHKYDRESLIAIKKAEDPEFSNRFWGQRYGEEKYFIYYFYFDGLCYPIYHDRFDPKGYNDRDRNTFLHSLYRDKPRVTVGKFKGVFKFVIRDGEALKYKAEKVAVDFSKEHSLPYFVYGCPLFFPFFMMSNVEEVFQVDEVYQNIENFLLTCQQKEPTLQSNENKITSHGFDLKTSFRGKR